MGPLFTRARALAWRPAPPTAPARLRRLAASHRRAETYCLLGLALLLALATALRPPHLKPTAMPYRPMLQPFEQILPPPTSALKRKPGRQPAPAPVKPTRPAKRLA